MTDVFPYLDSVVGLSVTVTLTGRKLAISSSFFVGIELWNTRDVPHGHVSRQDDVQILVINRFVNARLILHALAVCNKLCISFVLIYAKNSLRLTENIFRFTKTNMILFPYNHKRKRSRPPSNKNILSCCTSVHIIHWSNDRNQ